MKDAVKLQFCPLVDEDEMGIVHGVAAVDPQTGLIIISGELRLVAHWLKNNGYTWVVGSNALWTKED